MKRSFRNTALSFFRKNAGVYRAARTIGGPLYRLGLGCASAAVGLSRRWTFPKSVPHAFRIGFALGRWEPEATKLFKRELFDGAVVIDIGANVGYYARLAAPIVGPRGRVYAFEPEAENFRYLRENTRFYSNVTAVRAAIDDKPGLRRLFLSPLAGCHSLVTHEGDSGKGRWEWVPTMTFDQFVESTGLDMIDLVKIDVEGAEPSVLRGMELTIKRRSIGAMIVEYSPRLLRDAGFAPIEFVASLSGSFEIRVIETAKYGLNWDRVDTEGRLDELTARIMNDGPWGCVNLFCGSKASAGGSGGSTSGGRSGRMGISDHENVRH